VAEGRRELEEMRTEGTPLAADVGEDDADQLRLEAERETEDEGRQRARPAQRGAFRDTRLNQRGKVVATDAEERLPAFGIPRDLGEHRLLAGAAREESMQGTVRRLAPEEPEALEAEPAQHGLADQAKHLLQLERRGDGAAHLVEGGHLLIPTALEEHVLMEDGAAVQLEEDGPQNRRHAAARHRENAVGHREIAPHTQREGGEIASRRPDRKRNLPA